MISETFSITKKNYRQWAPLVLRLIIGFGFMAHGWAKISRGPAGFEKLLALLHVPFPHLMSWLTAILELLGGMFIFSGLFVSVIAVPLIVTMLVALSAIHVHYGFSSVNTIGLGPDGPKFGQPGYEINLLYIAGLLSLILTGAGIFSLDSWIVRRKAG